MVNSVNNLPAYFGPGTTLTVLGDTTISPPKVKVLNPSQNEICTRRKTVTLVCVATEFYPDHIEVYWQINGVNQTHLSKTDNRALRNKNTKKYSITSRLRISLRKWYNTRNEFTCVASFYNGKDFDIVKSTINGAKGGVLEKDDVMSRSNWAKLSYGTLIAKSTIYGMFIFFVVWKLKGPGPKK